MAIRKVLIGNWLTRRPIRKALPVTLFLCLLILFLSSLGWQAQNNLNQYFIVSGELILVKFEIWRLWSAVFVHGDSAHLLSNLLLFTPFCYFLVGYFGNWFFPIIGIFQAGLINFFVVLSMPPQVNLLGLSGLVYWMGGAWLTLNFLLDLRDPLRRRLGKALVIAAVLFLPEKYQPQTSYLSHLLGFLSGMASAYLLYRIKLQSFKAAEIFVEVTDEEAENDT